jgi:hypothetical protein
VSVGNKIVVPLLPRYSTVLVSLEGGVDLEKMLNDALIDGFKSCLGDEKVKGDLLYTEGLVSQFYSTAGDLKSPMDYKGKYKLLGLFQDESTGSKLFLVIAQKYFAEYLARKTEELDEIIRNFLDKKLSDFAE